MVGMFGLSEVGGESQRERLELEKPQNGVEGGHRDVEDQVDIAAIVEV